MTAMLHEFDGVEIVAPAGFSLTAARGSMVEMVWGALADGDADLAQAVQAWAEAELGTTDFHRVEARAPAGSVVGPFLPMGLGAERLAGLVKSRSEQHIRARDERRHAVGLLVAEPELTQGIASILDEADRERAKAETAQKRLVAADGKPGSPVLTKVQRRAIRDKVNTHLRRARELADTAEARHLTVLERAYRTRQEEERKRLSEGRGERMLRATATAIVTEHRKLTDDLSVPVQRQRTVERVYKESGLDSMLRSKAGIGIIQFSAGERYRDLFEQAEPELGAPSGGSGGGRPDQKLSYSEARIWARDQLERINARVRHQAGGKALTALVEVAGKGRFIAELSSSGSGQVAFRVALKKALDIVADVMGMH